MLVAQRFLQCLAVCRAATYNTGAAVPVDRISAAALARQMQIAGTRRRQHWRGTGR